MDQTNHQCRACEPDRQGRSAVAADWPVASERWAITEVFALFVHAVLDEILAALTLGSLFRWRPLPPFLPPRVQIVHLVLRAGPKICHLAAPLLRRWCLPPPSPSLIGGGSDSLTCPYIEPSPGVLDCLGRTFVRIVKNFWCKAPEGINCRFGFGFGQGLDPGTLLGSDPMAGDIGGICDMNRSPAQAEEAPPKLTPWFRLRESQRLHRRGANAPLFLCFF